MSEYHVSQEGEQVEFEIHRRDDVLLTVFLEPDDAADIASQLFKEATQAEMVKDGVKTDE